MGSRKQPLRHTKHSLPSASRVFHLGLIAELPKKAAQNWLDVIDGHDFLNEEVVDVIALGLKNWAMQHGATHFTHWFQPLPHASPEKRNGAPIEKFQGTDLLRGEIDASSPSFGEGYTVWDPTVFPFLWESTGRLTLCIPAVFFSLTGSPLDNKLPLLRSEEKLNHAVSKLFHLISLQNTRVVSTLGVEQEYFLMDRSLFLLRPDLVLTGRTLFGASCSKGEELQDRVSLFIREFEEAAIQLGIPVKTGHTEQCKVSCFCERANLAVDHNVLMMELMQSFALKHNLACLFHEKPFKAIHGSSKKIAFSILTDEGENLLDSKGESLVFLILFTAILRACHEHAGLLGISSASSFVSPVFLGDALIDSRLSSLEFPETSASDLNQTPFLAFTGKQFEFQSIGASQHCAFLICVMNAIIADSLELILDEMSSEIKDEKLEGEALFQTVLPVLQKHLIKARKGPLGGAGRRDFSQLIEKKTLRVFQGILTEEELHVRFAIFVERFGRTVLTEAKLMIDLFQTAILPAAQKGIKEQGIEDSLIVQAIQINEELKTLLSQISDMGWEAKEKVISELILPKMDEFREKVDALEMVIAPERWPFPNYPLRE